MRTRNSLTKCAAACGVVLATLAGVYSARAQGTAFTYQGRLGDNGSLPNANYDMRFTLYDALTVGNQVGLPITKSGASTVPVNGGLFTTTLDFGLGIFTGADRWLKIEISPAGANTYTALSARQPLTPTPYAMRAGDAGTLGGQTPSAFAPASGSPSYAPASGSTAYVARAGDTMTGTLNILPANGFTVGGSQLVTSGGNVGIGISSPGTLLDVAGSSTFRGTMGFYLAGKSDIRLFNEGTYGDHTLTFADYSTGNRQDLLTIRNLLNTSDARVGIGTTAPQAMLDLRPVIYSQQIQSGGIQLAATDGHFPSGMFLRVNSAGQPRLAFDIASGEALSLLTGGNVGIGTGYPTAPLHIEGSRAYARFVATNDTDGSILELKNTTTGQNVILGQVTFRDANDNVESKITGGNDGSLAFWTGGPSSFGVKMTVGPGNLVTVPVLQINGADVAEPFNVSTKDLPKGSVVIIDEENPGKVKLSASAYDHRVAGILSGANGVNSGILLKQQGFNDGGENVALSGRVYALADASYGAIKPGDMLTTSDTPGHCMKVTNHAKAQGAIIGKAMSSLKAGKGMVLVLVSLQ